jgi:hypothetical protein
MKRIAIIFVALIACVANQPTERNGGPFQWTAPIVIQ